MKFWFLVRNKTRVFDMDTGVLEDVDCVPYGAMEVQAVEDVSMPRQENVFRKNVLFHPQGEGVDCSVCVRQLVYWGNRLLSMQDVWLLARERYDILSGVRCGVSGVLVTGKAQLDGQEKPVSFTMRVSCEQLKALKSGSWQLLKYAVVLTEQVDAVKKHLAKGDGWCPLRYENGCFMGMLGDTWQADESTMRRFRRDVLL